MREPLLIGLILVVSACVSPAGTPAVTNPTSTAPQEETTTTAPVEKSAVFDFSALEGDWSGTLGAQRDSSVRFPVEVSFEAEARRGSVVAKVTYTQMDGETCHGTLAALRADAPEYLLFQSMEPGSCPWPGQVRLLHNSQTGDLSYQATMETFDGVFTGSLERVDE